MDDIKDRSAVFERGSVPRGRRATKQRRASAKCCFIVVVSLGTLVGFFISALIAKTLIDDLDSYLSPHNAGVLKKGEPEMEDVSVKPLIDSMTFFDIRATVWLDVTSHLEQGGSLPSDLQVLHYRQANQEIRSEAVVYSGLLFKDATMDSHLHKTARIRFPVEPLYSQPLGPATLRATFQVLPRLDAPEGLVFNTSVPIYPPSLPIGPRQPNSTLVDVIKETNDSSDVVQHPETLEHALEHSAISVNLLALLPSQWRLNTSRVNVRADIANDSPMFDGSPSNRAFLNVDRSGNSSSNTSDNFYISSDRHRIMIPHVRTRSRIMMIREDRNFSTRIYTTVHRKAIEEVRTKCAELMNIKRAPQAEGIVLVESCQRPHKWSIYENLLHFLTTKDGGIPEGAVRNGSTDQLKYAPYLTQRLTSSASRHHRTIPRFPPGKGAPHKEKEDVCHVPMLETDESQQFFEFDWDVAFSSLRHMRATMAETDDIIGVSNEQEDFKDNGTDFRINTRLFDEHQWEISAVGFADREHRKSKPWRNVVHFIVTVTAPAFIDFLQVLYWYTRTNTQGLSQRGQLMSLGSKSFLIVSALLEAAEIKDGWLSWSTLKHSLSIASNLALGLLELITFLHLQSGFGWSLSRRPANKKERDTRRVDSHFGLWVPGLIFALYVALLRDILPKNLHIVMAEGCYGYRGESINGPTPRLLQAATFARQLGSALNNGGIVLQVIFNAQAMTYAGCFRIVAIVGAATQALDMAMSRSEKLSGWKASRAPVTLGRALALLVLSVNTYQAVKYRGISQVVPENDDEDDDDM